MGNTLNNTVQFLRDPMLVRKFQELCGVQQVLLEDTPSKILDSESDTEIDEATSVNSDEIQTNKKRGQERLKRGHGRESSNEYNTSESKILQNGSHLEWLKRKAKSRHRIKSSPTPSPGHSRTSSLDLDFDPTSIGPLLTEVTVESYPFLDIYFRLATECGYEPFYITFVPFLFWNIDVYVARHGIMLWCMSMYVGQACKQIFQWKRPANPPAFRLEQNPNLETEYGFPSTHAIVSTVLPFYFLYATYGRYEYPLWIGMLIACNWSWSVCFSRIYLGVHSVMDILGGILISVVILLLAVPNIAVIDHFLMYSSYSVYLTFFAVIFLLYIYPVNPEKWTMDRGDTAAILGSTFGLVWGTMYHGAYPEDLDPGPYQIIMPSLHCVSLSIVRFVIGVLLILPTRFVMKLLCFKLLPVLMPTHGVKEVVHRPLVELPYKIITYGAIGFNASYLAPYVFEICGISRW